MANQTADTSSKSNDQVFERWGCLIFIVAAILFAAQRFALYGWLLYSAAGGSATSLGALEFLFGNPPYSITDILLGLEFPDEGLFYILQPHNLAIGLTQAVHFGLTIGLASLPFFLFSQARHASRLRAIWALVGVVVTIAIPLSVLALYYRYEPSSQGTSVEYSEFSSPTVGISLTYPAFMEVEENTEKMRGSGGELVTMSTVLAGSKDPVIGIIVRTIEAPLRNQMFPDLYPPDQRTMALFVVSDMTNLQYPRTDANASAVEAASKHVVNTTISGFPAAEYTLSLEGLDIGHAYVRGARVVTDRRDVSLYVFGSDEKGAPGSTTPAEADAIWLKLKSSITIDF